MDRNDWPNQHKWLLEKIELFRKVFGPRVKTLDDQLGVSSIAEG